MRALILPFLLAGCAAAPDDMSGDRELAKITAGRNAGAPQSCINQSQIQGPQIVDARTVVYRQTGRRIWVNTLTNECPGLRPDATLVVEPFGSQLCENDRLRTVYPGQSIPGPYCRFGKFTPYDKPKS